MQLLEAQAGGCQLRQGWGAEGLQRQGAVCWQPGQGLRVRQPGGPASTLASDQARPFRAWHEAPAEPPGSTPPGRPGATSWSRISPGFGGALHPGPAGHGAP